MSATDVEPRRGPGRPRKHVTNVTKSEYIEDETPVDDSFPGLFDETVLRQVVRVRVIRKEPNEGTVGYLEDPTLGENEIFERWGGSSYLLQAMDAKGQVKKQTVIKIAGDPVFVSTTAEAQWRRSRGLPPVTAASAAATTDKGMSMQDLLMFMQSQDEKRRSEEREHQANMRRLELEARERERKDEEERDRRRAKDDEDRESRRRRDQQEAEQRSQQFMQQTIQMLQQSSNQALQFVRATAETAKPDSNNTLMEAVKTVVAIKDAFGGDGGSDAEESPMNLLIKHGAEWVNGLSNGIAGAIREVKGGGVSGANAGAPSTARSLTPAAQGPLALLPANHPINDKVETLVAKLAAKGLDPLAALSTIVDNVTKDVDRIPMRGQPAAEQPVRPFVQGPEGVANAAQPPLHSVPVTDDSPKVYRLKVGKK